MLLDLSAPLSIIHHNDQDGFTAAWLIHEARSGAPTLFFPTNYDEGVPNIPYGSNLCIVDFHYPTSTLLTIIKTYNPPNILLIDHHASAIRDLSPYLPGPTTPPEGEGPVPLPDNISFLLNPNHCGSVLVWSLLYPGRPIPLFLQYIEDWDLGTYALPSTHETRAFVHSCPMSLGAWNLIDLKFNSFPGLERMAISGFSIIQYQKAQLQSYLQRAAMLPLFPIEHPSLLIPVTSCTDLSLRSEVCLSLASFNRSFPVGATYYHNLHNNTFIFDLRALPTYSGDLSTLCSIYGGGGHPRAAGFVLTPEKFVAIILRQAPEASEPPPSAPKPELVVP